jgi:hypothetical protein
MHSTAVVTGKGDARCELGVDQDRRLPLQGLARADCAPAPAALQTGSTNAYRKPAWCGNVQFLDSGFSFWTGPHYRLVAGRQGSPRNSRTDKSFWQPAREALIRFFRGTCGNAIPRPTSRVTGREGHGCNTNCLHVTSHEGRWGGVTGFGIASRVRWGKTTGTTCAKPFGPSGQRVASRFCGLGRRAWYGDCRAPSRTANEVPRGPSQERLGNAGPVRA